MATHLRDLFFVESHKKKLAIDFLKKSMTLGKNKKNLFHLRPMPKKTPKTVQTLELRTFPITLSTIHQLTCQICKEMSCNVSQFKLKTDRYKRNPINYDFHPYSQFIFISFPFRLLTKKNLFSFFFFKNYFLFNLFFFFSSFQGKDREIKNPRAIKSQQTTGFCLKLK